MTHSCMNIICRIPVSSTGMTTKLNDTSLLENVCTVMRFLLRVK
ncbi:MAG: hypothetical protein O7161_03430 [Wolbachia endosymbiont of Halictus tumulorum]|nr:hypothetical protein [Wolbachia endosymbiont of Halictus tumulorum]